ARTQTGASSICPTEKRRRVSVKSRLKNFPKTIESPTGDRAFIEFSAKRVGAGVPAKGCKAAPLTLN
ncbi:hypothetical protein LW566_23085, partial [Pseudomonas juntendi]|uniref:hypothetical protein n=1 Tax=Pseudomonas juntendi TaxID=2666183 RepID=UPI002095D85E